MSTKYRKKRKIKSQILNFTWGNMNFAEFFEETGMPVKVLAERSDMTEKTLHSLLKGYDVRGSFIDKLRIGSKGKLTSKDIEAERKINEANRKAKKQRVA